MLIRPVFIACLSVLACIGISTGQVMAQSTPAIMIGGLVPGAPVLSKQIKSLRDLRYQNVVRQEWDFTCGAAALSTILQYVYGRTASERDIIADMLKHTDAKTVQQNGFSLLDMKKYVERAGLRGRGYQIDRNSLLTLKIPVIALQTTRGFPHFVVVKRIQDGVAYIADPALGNRQMPLDEFVAAWNGIVFAVVGAGLKQENVLLEDRTENSILAQRAGIVTRMLPQQQEFGLLGLDSF
jgi:predicted double-glycine peptidase